MIEDWHFGAAFPGKITSKTQTWPTFFCYEDPTLANLTVFMKQLILTTLTTPITVSSPIRTEPGLVQLANNNSAVCGICFRKRPLPKDREGKTTRDATRMVLENREAIKIARKAAFSVGFDDIVAAAPSLTNINALRIRMHKVAADRFAIEFATCILIGSGDPIMDANAEFEEKMRTKFLSFVPSVSPPTHPSSSSTPSVPAPAQKPSQKQPETRGPTQQFPDTSGIQ